MKRNTIYFFVLILLAAAVYFLVIKKPWNTLNASETTFAIEDTASIAKFFIADMEGNKITLERNGNGWMINQKYFALQPYMNMMLGTLARLTVSFPVPEAAQQNVIKDMSSRNTKVQVFDKSGKMIRSFLIGGPPVNGNGNYMLLDGAKRVYVVNITGFQGSLESRFSTKEEEIRSRSIYAFTADQIKSVSVQYAEKPERSFQLSVVGRDSFSLQQSNGKVVSTSQLDLKKVIAYLNAYKFINCEGFANDIVRKDSVLTMEQPFAIINVTDKKDQPHEVKCYYMPRNQTSTDYDAKGNLLTYDTDRYFATINNGADFVVIQQFHFGPLFQPYSYFLKSPAP